MKLIKPRANLNTAPKEPAVYLMRCREKFPGRQYGPWQAWQMILTSSADMLLPTLQYQFIGPCDLAISDKARENTIAPELKKEPILPKVQEGLARTNQLLEEMAGDLLAIKDAILDYSAQESKPGPILVDPPSTPVQEEIVAPAAEEKASRPDPVELGQEDPMPESVKQTWLAMFKAIKMLPLRVEETMQSKTGDWKVKDVERLKAIYAKFTGGGKPASFKVKS